ncbi:carbohydrate-binding module family 1 protein [Parathielavia hyrcaniae]|uniref:chitinase n=1 Tax=Parathielavia hyrcaniae TaxID=113614 RepID=A0AAN6PW96_9PEZI|nr:carbohydrate-binding module family 1 protein [Parathielavia hyrcaniae]
MPARLWLLALYGLLPVVPKASAGFDSGSSSNIAIYWGQNSINRADGQQRLATYCSNTPVNIIPIAFLTAIKNPTSVNFANAVDNCTTFPGTQLLRCPQIEEDIITCQSLNKSILLSIGGATYTEGGFSSTSEASAWASTLWSMFGPPPSSPPNNDTDTNPATVATLRPFGLASIDGFDLDIESAPTSHLATFASSLRQLIDNTTTTTPKQGKYRRILSAAPQCPFPDLAMRDLLEQVPLDFVSVQFYNNYCGAQAYDRDDENGPGNFNFARWDRWAREESVNREVKVLLGLPGGPTAAGSGYVSGEQLGRVVRYSTGFGSFGGVMVWDMSQAHGNTGFLDTIVAALGGKLPDTTTTATTTTSSTITTTTTSPTTTTSSSQPIGSLVPHWGQCGGRDFKGSTQCEPPYTCVFVGEWWSHCA